MGLACKLSHTKNWGILDAPNTHSDHVKLSLMDSNWSMLIHLDYNFIADDLNDRNICFKHLFCAFRPFNLTLSKLRIYGLGIYMDGFGYFI